MIWILLNCLLPDSPGSCVIPSQPIPNLSYRQDFLPISATNKESTERIFTPLKSHMHLIKSALEYRSTDELSELPTDLRGIYALYQKKGKPYELVYIGMSGKGKNGKIRKRLFSHKRDRTKQWSHFSYYEVWDNITDIEIRELEGLFRQLYRFDTRSNALNVQQTHKPLERVRRDTEKELGLKRITKKFLGI